MQSFANESEIESVFDKLGLTAYSDRALYIDGSNKAAGANYEIVISNTSNPFAA